MSADLPGLDQLRELPLPPPVSYWPQTWGWVFVVVVILALAGYASLTAMRRHKRNLYRRQALVELARIRTAVADQTLAARQLPDLLKRTALAAQSTGRARPVRAHTGAMRGEASGQPVESRCSDVMPPFCEDSGRLLATLAYAPDSAVRAVDPAALDQLFDASRRWIEGHRIERHHVAA